MHLNFLSKDPISGLKNSRSKTMPVLVLALTVGMILVVYIVHQILTKKSTMEEIEGILFLPVVIILCALAWAHNKARNVFWETFAKQNGATYIPKNLSVNESALMLNQGHSRTVEHQMFFKDKNISRLFLYNFTKKEPYEKNGTTYRYLVFGYPFNGSVPHLYLNYRKNVYSVHMEEKLPLPAEFEKNFDVSVPIKYEIEALQIFTPDLLEKIINLQINVDIEIVDGEVIFYVEDKMNFLGKIEKDLEQLQHIYNKVETLFGVLKPRLDGFSFAKIGDLNSNFIK